VLLIVDSNGTVVAQSQRVPVYWQWIVRLVADQYNVPVGTTVNLTASTNADLGGSGYSVVISADTGNSASCATGTTCVWQVSSNVAGSHQFKAYVLDSSGNAVTDSGKPVIISWTARVICPNEGTECLVLNPSSGDPNSSFSATWQDESNDPCDSFDQVTFYFDGQSVITAQADSTGSASVTFQLHSASLGDHTVSITDSCGDSQVSTTYSVFGTPYTTSAGARYVSARVMSASVLPPAMPGSQPSAPSFVSTFPARLWFLS
jgi:hypothetical protein